MPLFQPPSTKSGEERCTLPPYNNQSINQNPPHKSQKKKKNTMKKQSKSDQINQEEAHYPSSMMREKPIVVEREKPSPKPKQIRRRLHTRKPYQEKLLNMAEARREIVTALKLHRASMKHKMQSKPYTCPPHPLNNFYNNSWAVAPPPPIFEENDDFVLPDQTLGLNLNLEDFIVTTAGSTPSSSIYSPSTSSSTPPPPSTAEVVVDQFKFGEDVRSPFDGVMEFPAWLNANDGYVHDFSNFQDPSALPCMDIGEIEGMDGDWLA